MQTTSNHQTLQQHEAVILPYMIVPSTLWNRDLATHTQLYRVIFSALLIGPR